jgi:hypothetical protein
VLCTLKVEDEVLTYEKGSFSGVARFQGKRWAQQGSCHRSSINGYSRHGDVNRRDVEMRLNADGVFSLFVATNRENGLEHRTFSETVSRP